MHGQVGTRSENGQERKASARSAGVRQRVRHPLHRRVAETATAHLVSFAAGVLVSV